MSRPRSTYAVDCPDGHGAEHVHGWGHVRGSQRYRCHRCVGLGLPGNFYVNGENQPTRDPPAPSVDQCPSCGSGQVEQEKDGTWICWRCDWYKE